MPRNGGWPSLLYWAVAFALLTFAVVGMMSIGILILPVAVIALALVAWRQRVWPEGALGLPLGAGVVLLGIAFLDRNFSPCPESHVMVLAPGQTFSCGGSDPMPWLLPGLGLTAFGLVSYLAWRRTHAR